MALATINHFFLARDNEIPTPEVTRKGRSPVSVPRAKPQLPREIIKQIVTIAMIANNSTFTMPCLTNSVFRPQINLACLGLDWDLYHAARQALYAQNKFIFGHFGSDIKILANSKCLYTCRRQHCLEGGKAPAFGKVVFQLGDTLNPERAAMQIHAFGNVLLHLRNPLCINNLTLELAPYTWRSEDEVKAFCTALQNVTVLKTFTIKGLDVHLELGLRQLATVLRMKAQPVRFEACFRTAHWRQLGYFSCTYVRAQSVEESRVNNGGIIEDPLSKYREWAKTAREDCYVNGLDYVTNFGIFSH